MSTRNRVKRYYLKSQKWISETKAIRLLKTFGIVIGENNKDCLFMHANESMKHWVVKAIIFKILKDLGRTVGSEIEVRNGIVDIIDVNNCIAYEIESRLDEKRIRDKKLKYYALRDVFILDLDEIPNDIKSAEVYLKAKIV